MHFKNQVSDFAMDFIKPMIEKTCADKRCRNIHNILEFKYYGSLNHEDNIYIPMISNINIFVNLSLAYYSKKF